MTRATPQGASIENDMSAGITEDDAAEALLRRMLPPGKGGDADTPSPEKKDEDDTEQHSEKEGDTDADADTPSDEEKPNDEEKDEDDENEDEDGTAEVTIKVKVGDKVEEVPASKLARLYGQEASLTKKSMEVAEQRKQFDTKLTEATTKVNYLLEHAMKRFEPYSKLDFNLLGVQVARGELTEDDYTALRQGAQAAFEDVKFLQQEAGALSQSAATQKNEDTRKQAIETIKVLSGPTDKGGIEGFNEKLYGDICSFAVTQGVPTDIASQTVDAPTLRMWHHAMLYARGRNKAKSNVTVTKVNKTPKKVVKTSSSPSARDGKSVSNRKAMDKLRTSGTTDDAAEALLAGWKRETE